MNKALLRILHYARLCFSVLLLAFILFLLWFTWRTRISPPVPKEAIGRLPSLENPSSDFYRLGNNWLKKNRYGLWEMYTEGSPYERGFINGRLSEHLIATQEKAFIGQIHELVPSRFYLNFLRYFIFWFNRDLDDFVPGEYQNEILGISRSAAAEFNFIGSPYQRLLNYHSAHDIGHMLQDYNLVGCTGFAAWDEATADGSLLVCRNFDFYVGDDFSKEKIVSFVKPDKGYGFMMITWGGMIGTVSGMNEAGLTVTINSARSEIPTASRTPVSILAREILQYASTIREADSIAGKRRTFVSESFLIGSARDRSAAVIEKSPSSQFLLLPGGNRLCCANHFQSPAFTSDPAIHRDRIENATGYRMRRLEQLLDSVRPMDEQEAAVVLRDRRGLDGADIGSGNEMALNQLIAHHSVIFKPEQRLVWVSTAPWQCGPYVCYDLTRIFHTFAGLRQNAEITETERVLPSDPFLETKAYKQFLSFREMRKQLLSALRSGKTAGLSNDFPASFTASNPRYFQTYELLGDYYAALGDRVRAREAYRFALTLEIPRKQDRDNINKKSGLRP